MKYAFYFYNLYKDEVQNRPQLVDDLCRIPWGHHRFIIDKIKSEPKKALFYVEQVIQNNWSSFAYMGREYRLEVGNTEQFLDMLFYNTKLRCYVVIEVKTGKFEPSFIGQLGTYVAAVNHILKTEQDNPTLGILICKDKDNVLAKYSLESSAEPLTVH